MFTDDPVVDSITQLRFFNSANNEKEFKECLNSPFIRCGDIILYDKKAYIVTITGEAMIVSYMDNITEMSFFHRYNIGDKIRIYSPAESDPSKQVEGTIVDYHYHFTENTCYYVVQLEDKSIVKVRSAEADLTSTQIDKTIDTPLSVLTYSLGLSKY